MKPELDVPAIKEPFTNPHSLRKHTHGPLSSIEIKDIEGMGHMPLDSIIEPGSELSLHSRRFRRDRHIRLVLVQQMTLSRQAAFYREKGYF